MIHRLVIGAASAGATSAEVISAVETSVVATSAAEVSGAAISRAATLLALGLTLVFATPAAAQVSEAASALRSDPVFVDPSAELADQVDAAALRSQIGQSPAYVAVLPASAVEGSPGRTLVALRQAVGEEGRYALVVGNDLRTLPADPGEQALAAHPDDMQAALTQFISSVPDEESGGGSAVAGVLAVLVLVAVAAGGVFLLVSRRRARAGDGRSEARTPDVHEDFVRLGDGIRAIELDVTLTENAAAKADYDRAVDAYDRANAHQRKGDEPAADRALDEGLAAIGSAQERLAGRKPR
jgi:hypothetical protein